MAKSIQISKSSSVYVPEISSLKLVVEAINPENMPSKIFVNQRIRNFAQDRIDDTFVAVCTPVQLEDFAEDCPEPGTSYYRTDRIELVGRTPEMIQAVFDSLVYEVKKLVVDLTDMDNMAPAVVYNVSAQGPVWVSP